MLNIRHRDLYLKFTLYLFALAVPVLLQFLEDRGLHGWISTLLMVSGVGGMIWALSRRDRQIQKLLGTDNLTGLPNRQSFFEDLLREVTRAQRYKLPLSLAYLNVNNFRSVNRHFGNGDGDLVLTRLAYQFNVSIRQNLDTCYRIGADEFAILLPNTKLEEVQVVFDRINMSLTRASSNLKKYNLTLAIGMVQLKEEENLKHFVDRAIADMQAYRQIPKTPPQ